MIYFSSFAIFQMFYIGSINSKLNFTTELIYKRAWIDLMEIVVPEALEAAAESGASSSIREGLPSGFMNYMGVQYEEAQDENLPDSLKRNAEEEKAFALGIQFVIFRLFGYIPSPILFGHVIDSTCLLWKSTCDGEAGGRCLMYDIEAFRFK